MPDVPEPVLQRMIVIKATEECSKPHSSLIILVYASYRTLTEAFRVCLVISVGYKRIAGLHIDVKIVEGTDPQSSV